MKSFPSGDASTSSEETQPELLADILPSFEFYYNLHRNIPSLPVGNDFYEHPPSYQSSVDDQISDITCPSSVSTANHPRAASATIESLTIPAATEGAGLLPIEKLYTLPDLRQSVSVEIYVTKQPYKINQPPEFEDILKEYTSGDVIHGYVVIENKSNEPIKFDMFYLTLEGVATRYETVGGRKKRYLKRFLRMVELSASWCYVVEDINSGNLMCSLRDQYDGSRYGLSNDRLLLPGIRRKKNFTFKVPSQLLDDTCPQNHFSHKLLPPSLAVDRYENRGMHNNLDFLSTLGYYRQSSRGSPLLTSDMSDDASVTYAIDGKLVGRSKSGHSCILSQNKFHLRVIPFGFDLSPVTPCETSQGMTALEKSILSRLQVMDVFFTKLEKGEPLTREDLEDISDDDHRQARTKYSYVSELGLHREEEKNFNIDSGKQGIVDSGMAYSMRRRVSLEERLKFTKGSSNPRKDKNGVLNLKVICPRSHLPYAPPHLMKAKNSLAQKTKTLQESVKQMKSSISIEDCEALKGIKFAFTCSESKSGEEHNPPTVNNVTAELLCLTQKSQGCHLVPMSPAFLLDQTKFRNFTSNCEKIRNKIEDYRKRFAADEERFKNLFFDAEGLELGFYKIIPKYMIEEISRLASMEADVQVASNYLKVGNVDQIKKLPWFSIASHEFKMSGEVKLTVVNPQKLTLVPSFESCLFSRHYFVRLTFIFDNSVGQCTVDAPVQVRNLYND